MSYELYLEPIKPTRNRKTGHFLKGHEPHNKGKKWSEYMGKRAQKRAAKGWRNVQEHRPTTRPDTAGRCRKQVVAVLDDGRFRVFEHLQPAAEWVGGSRENVGRCCRQNESTAILRKGAHKGTINNDHKYNGVRFYFMSNDAWWDKVPSA